MKLVTGTLLRMYWPFTLFLCGAAIVGIGIALYSVHTFGEITFSLWVTVVGTAAKWWSGVVGVVLVATHLKQFVTAGLTRHAFLRGAAVFGLLAAVLIALVVTAGHGAEQALVRLAGPLPAGYPAISVAGEFGRVLVTELAYLAAGAAITAGFYRFGPWPGILFVLPGLLPVLAVEGLFGFGPDGAPITRLLPVGWALLVILAATGLAAAIFYRQLRDVAIRRTAA